MQQKGHTKADNIVAGFFVQECFGTLSDHLIKSFNFRFIISIVMISEVWLCTQNQTLSAVIIQMKATEQNVPVVQFIMSCKAMLDLVFTDFSNFSWTILSNGERCNEVNPMWSTNPWDKARPHENSVPLLDEKCVHGFFKRWPCNTDDAGGGTYGL